LREGEGSEPVWAAIQPRRKTAAPRKKGRAHTLMKCTPLELATDCFVPFQTCQVWSIR